MRWPSAGVRLSVCHTRVLHRSGLILSISYRPGSPIYDSFLDTRCHQSLSSQLMLVFVLDLERVFAESNVKLQYFVCLS